MEILMMGGQDDGSLFFVFTAMNWLLAVLIQYSKKQIFH